VEECGPCPVFASFTLAFALQLREKHGKASVRVRKTSVRLRKPSVKVQYTYYQKHPHITKPSKTHRYFKVDGSMEKIWYTVYPSGLEKTLCKWDIYVLLVTKGLNELQTVNCRMLLLT
jgi:hypothetical protein